MLLTVGSIIKDNDNNKYILKECFGVGGCGYVFKAIRENDNSLVAVKTMLPTFSDQFTVEAFKNEIRSTLKIKGENIIEYIYVHSGDEFLELPPYIIMEYADGGSLNDLLNQKRKYNETFENKDLLAIFKQLANGMKEVNRKLVHRDIKPANILICGDIFKITDFGLSKISIESTRSMTFKGGGTPLYMSPEAFDFSQNTIQMDIYSMGIVFYELATLRYPYQPIPQNYENCKDAHLLSPMVNPSQVNKELSSGIVSIINRMLEKPTQIRFTSWDDIIHALDAQTKSTESDSTLQKAISVAISAKNADDVARQKKENTAKKKKNEKDNFYKLACSQFNNTFVSPIKAFVENINSQYAGKDKFYIPVITQTISHGEFSWKIDDDSGRSLSFEMKVVFDNTYQRDVSVPVNWATQYETKRENYIPRYSNKNILVCGKMENNKGYGYNLLLVDSGSIYGDWFIMKNKNNLSNLAQERERREPFAFSLNELPSEIYKTQITSLYSATFEPFNGDNLLNYVNLLLFTLQH